MVQTLPASVNTPTWLDHLQVLRLDAELAPDAPWTLPAEPETLLRGVMGNALFELLCARSHRRCAACDLRDRCEIPGWYDPGRLGDDRPRPLLPRSLNAPGERVGPGRPWRARWLALGAPPRSSALQEALVRLARLGLGEARIPHRLARLSVQGEGARATVILDDRETRTPWPTPTGLRAFVQVPADVIGVDVQVIRPTRWRDAEPSRWPTAGELLGAALSRVRQVAREQGQSLDAWWDDPLPLDQPWSAARWVRCARENSQGERHDLSGWIGSLRLGPEVRPWVDLLCVAELLSVGKHVSFGRGQIQLRWSVAGEDAGPDAR